MFSVVWNKDREQLGDLRVLREVVRGFPAPPLGGCGFVDMPTMRRLSIYVHYQHYDKRLPTTTQPLTGIVLQATQSWGWVGAHLLR
jgi:hypothetical protein